VFLSCQRQAGQYTPVADSVAKQKKKSRKNASDREPPMFTSACDASPDVVETVKVISNVPHSDDANLMTRCWQTLSMIPAIAAYISCIGHPPLAMIT